MRGIQNDWLIQDAEIAQGGLQAQQGPAPGHLRCPWDISKQFMDGEEKLSGKGFDRRISVDEHAQGGQPLEPTSFFLIRRVTSFDQRGADFVYLSCHHALSEDDLGHGSIGGEWAHIVHLTKEKRQQKHPQFCATWLVR